MKLGMSHYSLQQCEAARAEFAKAQRVRRKLLGTKHADTAAAANWLGDAYRMLSQYNSACVETAEAQRVQRFQSRAAARLLGGTAAVVCRSNDITQTRERMHARREHALDPSCGHARSRRNAQVLPTRTRYISSAIIIRVRKGQ